VVNRGRRLLGRVGHPLTDQMATNPPNAGIGDLLGPLIGPERLWHRAELLAHPGPTIPNAGVYAWYFRGMPQIVPQEECKKIDGCALLYLGIAPSSEASRATLRGRIRQHLKGNASGSTLRLSLGCVLSDNLNLRLQPTGHTGRLTFADGESELSRWMEGSAFVVWNECPQPWIHEAELIRALRPPLNLDHNEQHPFCNQLRVLRQRHRQAARGTPPEAHV